MKPVFKEEQNFTQLWLWILLTGIGLIPILGIYKQLILGEKFGEKPMPDIVLILFSLLVFGIIAFIKSIRLSTEIDKNEIRIHFYPLLKKQIKWNEVKHAEVENYGFVGGWGIRFWPKYGTIYNIKGNKGLVIELLNGKKLVIGTQKESELKLFLEGLRIKDIVHKCIKNYPIIFTIFFV